MAQDAITVTGIEQYQDQLRKMQTDNPRHQAGVADIKNQPLELLNSTA